MVVRYGTEALPTLSSVLIEFAPNVWFGRRRIAPSGRPHTYERAITHKVAAGTARELSDSYGTAPEPWRPAENRHFDACTYCKAFALSSQKQFDMQYDRPFSFRPFRQSGLLRSSFLAMGLCTSTR